MRMSLPLNIPSGGVNFAQMSTPACDQFQQDVLQTILQLESVYENLAHYEASEGRNCVVLCDRGAMDASACKIR